MENIKYFTVKEVAELFNVNIMTIYNYWIKSGKLKCLKLGRSIRITQEQIDTFIKLSNK